MTVPWQIAQKLHAVTSVLGEGRVNDRAHDLVDLQLLEGLLPPTELSSTRSACIAVFVARAAFVAANCGRNRALASYLLGRIGGAGPP